MFKNISKWKIAEVTVYGLLILTVVKRLVTRFRAMKNGDLESYLASDNGNKK